MRLFDRFVDSVIADRTQSTTSTRRGEYSIMANGTATPGVYSKRALGSLFGRYNGPELFTNIPFVAGQSVIVQKAINLARPLDAIKLVWRGRVVIGTAAINPIASEAPQTIINRIVLTGTHARFGNLRPIDISGATAFAWPRMFQLSGSTLLINGTRQPELTAPLQQVGATFGNVATYDLEIHYHIPVGPYMPPSSRMMTIPFSYFPDDWADSLQLRVDFGDGTSFGTLGTSTVTFSAFGSGTGSPTVEVHLCYHMLGVLAKSIDPAVTIRAENLAIGGNLASLQSGYQLTTLQKQKTTNVVLKSGTILAGTSAGVQVFSALSDVLLNRTQITVDNKPIRNNTSNYAQKEYVARQFNAQLPQGYFDFTFVDSMNPLTYLRGDRVAPGANLALITDILTANAQNAVAVVQEQVFGTPRGKL